MKHILILTLLLLTASARQEPGSDHPMLSRYTGSVMKDYGQHEYDEGIVPLGKLESNEKFARKVNFEGKITYIRYQAPKDRSTLERMRNYRDALTKQDFKVVWQCKNRECGKGGFRPSPSVAGKLSNIFYINDNLVRAMTAKLTRNGKDAYVFISMLDRDTYLYVFEPEGMDSGMVTADALATEMAETGKAVLHINFASGKAGILDDSLPVLDQVADMMRKYPDMKISIEGHTDSQGSASANKTLSQKRADAVKYALEERQIDDARMLTKGLGESMPVADNATSEGRAQNRRVEIVNLTPDALGDATSAKTASSHDKPETNAKKEAEQKPSETERYLNEKAKQKGEKMLDKTVDSIWNSLF